MLADRFSIRRMRATLVELHKLKIAKKTKRKRRKKRKKKSYLWSSKMSDSMRESLISEYQQTMLYSDSSPVCASFIENSSYQKIL